MQIDTKANDKTAKSRLVRSGNSEFHHDVSSELFGTLSTFIPTVIPWILFLTSCWGWQKYEEERETEQFSVPKRTRLFGEDRCGPSSRHCRAHLQLARRKMGLNRPIAIATFDGCDRHSTRRARARARVNKSLLRARARIAALIYFQNVGQLIPPHFRHGWKTKTLQVSHGNSRGDKCPSTAHALSLSLSLSLFLSNWSRNGVRAIDAWMHIFITLSLSLSCSAVSWQGSRKCNNLIGERS